MKMILKFMLFMMWAVCVPAQPVTAAVPDCDCPDCRKSAADAAGFSLPGLEGLNDEPELTMHDADEHEHDAEDAHEHDADEHDHEAAEHDHEGHDHGAEGVVDPHGMMADAAGIVVREAQPGMIEKTTVFPAEIKLNRDRSAAVSPRYASLVRQVFAEIGDAVRKGDALASLENRETLAVYTVVAPLDGVVISKNLSVGETASADNVLYEVADLSSVWADISIFPQYRHLIKKGAPVEFVAHDGHRANGMVQYISPIVSHETRTFTARCVLVGAGDDFTPGAFVRARMRLDTVHAEVRIEQEAVQTMDGETVVFVPSGDGFEAVPVATGAADEHFVEIRHGLETGDRYVAQGAFPLKAELMTSGMDPHAGHNH